MKKLIIFFLITFCILNCTFYSAKAEKWAKDKREWTPLMKAIFKGNKNEVLSILRTDSLTINYITPLSDLTAMKIAIRKNKLEIIDILFKQKNYIFLNKIDSNTSEMFEACIYSKLEVIKYFINCGVNINSEIRSNDTLYALNIISHRSKKDILWVIENGASINIQSNRYLTTILFSCAFSGDLKKVKILLEHGADKSIKNKEGKRAYDMVDEIYPSLHISKRKKERLRELLK